MDEHMGEAIQMTVWVFLFIFALSFAILQYTRINSLIDSFVDINMISGRGDSTSIYLEESEIKRVARRSEIILSILNIPTMVNENGNSKYKVEIDTGGSTATFEYYEELDSEDNVISQGVELSGEALPLPVTYYLKGVIPTGEDDTKELISDLEDSYTTNATDTYSISYDADGIYYKKN